MSTRNSPKPGVTINKYSPVIIQWKITTPYDLFPVNMDSLQDISTPLEIVLYFRFL